MVLSYIYGIDNIYVRNTIPSMTFGDIWWPFMTFRCILWPTVTFDVTQYFPRLSQCLISYSKVYLMCGYILYAQLCKNILIFCFTLKDSCKLRLCYKNYNYNIQGHQRSPKATKDHHRSPKVTKGHQRSSKVTKGHQQSPKITKGHKQSP